MVVSIWITDNCNMNCDYCYEGKKGGKNMPLGYIDKIIEFINRQHPLSGTDMLYIKFFGGEPLLNFEFIKKFVTAVQLQNYNFPIMYSITTNGTLLDSEKISFMIENDMECSISVDGVPRVHDRHRKMKNGCGSWEYVEKNLFLLTEQKRLNLTARMTFTSETVSYLFESVKFLVRLGFKRIQAVADYFDKNWDDKSFNILATEYRRVKELRNDYSAVSIILGMQEKNARKGYTGCGGGKTTFSINIKGDIYPCTYAVEFSELKLGNIFHLNEYRIPDFSTKSERRKNCAGCKYFQICISGRCIFLNYKITGDYYSPGDFFCAYQKLEYKYMGI